MMQQNKPNPSNGGYVRFSPLVGGLCALFLAGCPAAKGPSQGVNACDRFHPGHQFKVADDNTRNADGLAILQNALRKDIKNFNGVVYQITWGMIETGPGVYDWSRIDKAFELVKSQRKFFRVRVEDRTYWSGCNANFIPPHVAREVNSSSKNLCYAKIWEQATMDQYIALLKSLVKRYADDPDFLGVEVEETALDSVSLRAQFSLYLDLYAQLKRLAKEVHAAAPGLLFTQELNWPYQNDLKHFRSLADNLVALGGGGGIGWPDSLIAKRATFTWYQLAPEYYKKLLIAPSIESPPESSLSAALADQEAVYQMLTVDLHANIIVWDVWNPSLGNNYFTDVVIPIVNKHNGEVQNKACPFANSH